MASDEFLIPPPSNMTVDYDRRRVLYSPDGRALVRQVGFRVPAQKEATMPCKGSRKGGKKK